jgi:hypothetical protein
LEPGLDPGVVAHGRLVYRRPDANSHSSIPNTDSGAYADTRAHSGAYADTESWHRMQRGSSLERNCDLYRRHARECERLYI